MDKESQIIQLGDFRVDLAQIDASNLQLPNFPDGSPPPDIGNPLFSFPLEDNPKGSNWQLVVSQKPNGFFGFSIFGFGWNKEIDAIDISKHGKPFTIAMLKDVIVNSPQGYDQPIEIENAIVDHETGQLKVGDVFPHIWFETDGEGKVKKTKIAVHWQIRPAEKVLEVPRAAVIHPNPPKPDFTTFERVDLDKLDINPFFAANPPRIIANKPQGKIKTTVMVAFASEHNEPPLQSGWFWMHYDKYASECQDGISLSGLMKFEAALKKVSSPEKLPIKK